MRDECAKKSVQGSRKKWKFRYRSLSQLHVSIEFVYNAAATTAICNKITGVNMHRAPLTARMQCALLNGARATTFFFSFFFSLQIASVRIF